MKPTRRQCPLRRGPSLCPVEAQSLPLPFMSLRQASPSFTATCSGEQGRAAVACLTIRFSWILGLNCRPVPTAQLVAFAAHQHEFILSPPQP